MADGQHFTSEDSSDIRLEVRTAIIMMMVEGPVEASTEDIKRIADAASEIILKRHV